MIPSAFVTLPAFPLTPNGKIDRGALPRLDTARPDLAATFIAPRTPLEQQIVHLWENLLGIAPIGVRDSFFDLGGHSLLAVRLIARLQEQFGRELPLSALFRGATIEHLAQLIDQASADALWSPLVAIQPAGARRPFFGVHPIGGSVLCYLELSRALGPDQPFYGLQAADLTEIGAQAVRIEDMAASYITAMRAIQPHGPYQLGGWSFGGIVAFEIAQQLCRQGEAVGVLALLDSYPGMTIGKADNVSDAMILAVLAKEQALALGQEFPVRIDVLQDLEPQEQLAHVLGQIERAGLDFGTELTWVRRFLQGYRAREHAVHGYRPQVYPGRITLFRSREHDAEIAKVQAAMGADFSNRTYGWDTLSSEPIEMYEIPGYHNTLVLGPNAALVATYLSSCFEKVL